MHHLPAASAADAPAGASLFETLFDLSLTGILLLRPIYAASPPAIADLAYVRLNLAAQRLLNLPAQPDSTLLARFPHVVDSGLFAFYCEAFQSGQPRRRDVYYQHDGLDAYFWLAAQRNGEYLVVSLSEASEFMPIAASLPGQEGEALASTYAGTPQAKSRQHLRNVNAELVALTVELSATSQALASATTRLADTQQQLRQLTRTLDTQVQERTETLAKTNQHLTQVNRDLDYFIYSASHDLRAPIANLEGLLYALDSTLPPDHALRPDVQPLLAMMYGAVRRFHETITHLTEISLVAQEATPPAAPVNLAELVADVQLDLAPLIESYQAHVQVDITDCPPMRLSAKHLRSIVFNLLSNALKYRHPGRAPQVRIWCRTTGTATELSVQDNGLGLTPAQQGQLFQLFHRLHHHVEGSGVGLYLIKKMVENAGGTLTVQSQAGVGSTFVVSVPA